MRCPFRCQISQRKLGACRTWLLGVTRDLHLAAGACGRTFSVEDCVASGSLTPGAGQSPVPHDRGKAGVADQVKKILGTGGAPDWAQSAAGSLVCSRFYGGVRIRLGTRRDAGRWQVEWIQSQGDDNEQIAPTAAGLAIAERPTAIAECFPMGRGRSLPSQSERTKCG